MKLAVLAVVSAFTIAGGASASTVNTLTDSATTGLVGTDFSSMPSTGMATLPALELALFDRALGALSGVSITISAVFETFGALTNHGVSGMFSLTQTVEVIAMPNVAGASSVAIALAETVGPTLFDPGETQTIALSDAASVTATPAVAGFIGGAGDMFTVDFASFSSSTVAGGGNLNTVIATNAEVSAAVEYTYLVPVPAPLSAPLLIAALAGFGFIAQKRRLAA